jgi:hypothetical protein
MSDTPAQVLELYRRLLLQRSGVERLKMGSDMFDTARTLVRASLSPVEGSAEVEEFRVQLLLRTYAGDVDPGVLGRVIQCMKGQRPAEAISAQAIGISGAVKPRPH